MIRPFTLLALLLLLPVAATQLPADSPERPNLVIQRSKLLEKARDLYKEERFASALQMLEERLKVEIKLFGTADYELAETYEAIAVEAAGAG